MMKCLTTPLARPSGAILGRYASLMVASHRDCLSQGCSSLRWVSSSTQEDYHITSLQNQVDHLSTELQHTREIVRQLVPLVDKARHGERLTALATNLDGGGGLFIPENSSALMTALQTPGARIVLREGYTYILSLYTPVTITKTHVTIIGNQATIIGCLAASNDATLDVCNCFFFAPGCTKITWIPPGERPAPPNTVLEPAFESGKKSSTRKPVPDRLEEQFCTPPLPILSATQNSTLHVRQCALVNGRDGVYLGVNSQAYLDDVAIRNCIRGIYQGVGCHVTVHHCELSGNYYHGVFLGSDAQQHLKAFSPGHGDHADQNTHIIRGIADPEDVCPPGFSTDTPIVRKRCRADVALDHDIIADEYQRTYVGGQPVDLPRELATAGLSDPSY